MTNLRHWLEAIGLGQYAGLFAENDINFDVLRDLDERDLEKLGVSVGHRKELLGAAAKLRAENEPPRKGASNLAGSKAERRHLTVLFCDIVGSTTLSARLDPEDLQDILRAFQRCCEAAIDRYGGYIARFMGDGVLAYFGFPTTHEDDPERAVNAALQIVQLVSAQHSQLAHRLEVRIGIATGLVVVGDLIGQGPAEEFALVGAAPNLAARLQQLAQPNQILVAPHTKELLGSLFDFTDLGMHSLRGFDQPICVWSVLKPSSGRSRFEAHQSSALTPLVGRERELALLEEKYQEAKLGNGQVITISGEPGIGKSRLVAALKERLSGRAFCPAPFQCSSFHTNSPWYPIIRYLEDAARIAPNTPPALRPEQLVAFIDQHLPEQRQLILHLLAAVMSIPIDDRQTRPELSPQQRKNQTFAALLSVLQAQANGQPLVLVFEDVHWIDPTSLEFVEWIRDRVQRWQMLVILLFRSDFSLSWMDQKHITSLTIDRLDAPEVLSMVDSLVGGRALHPTLAELIVAKTDGVPLFVEEMTKTALEYKSPSNETVAPDAQSTFGVPDTLKDLLMARFDRVQSIKIVAQVAAAIGREFSFDLLSAIVPLTDLDLRTAIDDLLSSGLLLPRDPALRETYVFKHALVQDAAYASLLRSERPQLHFKIANTLCERFSEISETAPELVAHHYVQARAVEPAIAYWIKAGQQASKRSAFVEATRHFQNAVQLLSERPATLERDKAELQLQSSLGSALIAAKGFGASETREAFRRALDLCENFDASPQTFAILNGMVGVHLMRAEFEQSREVANTLLARALRQDDSTPRLMGHRALGMSLFMIGEFTAARGELRNALELYDINRHGSLALVFSQDFKATAQAYLSLTSVLLGDMRGGLVHGQDAVAHAEGLRHPHTICYVLPFLAGSYLIAGMPKAAHPIAERTIALSTEYGFPLWLAGGLMLRGWARLELADVERGLADIRRSLDELDATGTLVWVQFARFLLAQALAKGGQSESAMIEIEQILAELGSGRWYEAEVHRLKGELLANQGDPTGAEACFERAIAVAIRQEARAWQLRAINALGAFLRTQGRLEELPSRLAPLYSSFDYEVAGVDLQRAKALLAETASKGNASVRSAQIASG